MKQNNKGFTLIELIVAAAILGIIALGAGGFMVAGARSYRVVSTNVGLQYTAQRVENQMQEMIMECNTALYSDGGELYLAHRQDDGYVVYAYTVSKGKLYLQKASGVHEGTKASAITVSQKHLLAEDVYDLSILSVDRDAATGKAVALTYTVTFDKNGRTQTSTQTIALRNRPMVADTPDDLIAACTNTSD